ncbi:hypothetical protein CEXT_691001 [Caerostris extrusa]|uniref:Uncharacterized protein n=1 Tax=Caerostris extrusa TaxID=172846 RepID=A0AAV4ME03_CAEEX|nr:hypothetical protein CEXT_691001 [Caerostris extrusa]
MDDALTSQQQSTHRFEVSWSFPVTLTNSAIADDRLTIMMRSHSIITIAYLTDFIRFSRFLLDSLFQPPSLNWGGSQNE